MALLNALLDRPHNVLSSVQGWLVGCFGLSGPLRQYFSLYRAVSQGEGEREERIKESKNVQTNPTRTYCKRNRPLPYYHPNCRTPRHWKFTQDHRTTRPPPRSCLRKDWHSLLYADLSGPKHPTSSGCIICEVWGGSTKNTILLFLLHSARVKLMCDLLPSNKTSLVSSFIGTIFFKYVSIYSTNTSEFDHLFSVKQPAHPLYPSLIPPSSVYQDIYEREVNVCQQYYSMQL